MGWIAVEDRMPPVGERVLVYDENIPNFPRSKTKVVIGYYRSFDWLNEGWYVPDGRIPTHWMPLPDYPKEEE